MSIMKKRIAAIAVMLMILCAIVSGCQTEPASTPTAAEQPPIILEETKEVEQPMSEEVEAPEPTQIPVEFELTSNAFLEGEPVPSQYACDGENVSPPLVWSGAPDETVTFALIMDDPDAPMWIWVHWVLFNIPGDATALDQGIPAEAEAPDRSRQGTNSWGNSGYGGPCPPSGTHRYYFKLYALDAALDLDESATKDDVLAAMEGHILKETVLMGTYAASGGCRRSIFIMNRHPALHLLPGDAGDVPVRFINKGT